MTATSAPPIAALSMRNWPVYGALAEKYQVPGHRHGHEWQTYADWQRGTRVVISPLSSNNTNQEQTWMEQGQATR